MIHRLQGTMKILVLSDENPQPQNDSEATVERSIFDKEISSELCKDGSAQNTEAIEYTVSRTWKDAVERIASKSFDLVILNSKSSASMKTAGALATIYADTRVTVIEATDLDGLNLWLPKAVALERLEGLYRQNPDSFDVSFGIPVPERDFSDLSDEVTKDVEVFAHYEEFYLGREENMSEAA